VTEALTVRAHAKVNLGLAVTGRRPDGFHDLHTIFVRLALADTLTMRAADTLGGRVEFSGAGETAPLAIDDDNLVVRAARAYLERAGLEPAVQLLLRKRIPIAAGLGGGSSDAAATMSGLSRLFPEAADRVGEAQLGDLALELGSDIPFFLAGQPAAEGRGRGERLSPLQLLPLHLVLVKPPLQVSAAAAYGVLQETGPELPIAAIVDALNRGEEPPYRNDLQPGVKREWPQVNAALTQLREQGLRGVLMSGSGPTCFGIADTGEQARQAAERIRSGRPDWWVWAGPTET